MTVLSALLEEFSPSAHPRDWHGRFRVGDVVRVKGSKRDDGTEIVGRIQRFADDGKKAIVAPEHGGAHIEATPAQIRFHDPMSASRSLARRSALDPAKDPNETHRERASDRLAITQAKDRRAGGGRVREEAVMERPDLLGALTEGFDDRRHPRGFHGRFIATFEHPVHGRTTSPIEANSSTEAWSKAEVRGRESGSVVQSVVPHDENARAIGRAEDKVRQPGISEPKAVRASLHPGTTRDLTSLGMGRWYPAPGGGGHVRRTEKGFEIYPHGSPQPVATHKTPSAAAAHAIRLGFADTRQAARGSATVRRRATLGRAEGDAAARTRAEILAKSPSAAAELARHQSIMASARSDRHGGFKVGERVTYREPSIVSGKVEGHGPEQTREVAGLQRNGYLRLREPKFGTTVDVHHSKVRRA